MEMDKHFEAGTIIRCNRCDTKGKAPRGFRAIRENDRVWRIQDMMTHPVCGHMDAHWVFNCDGKIAVDRGVLESALANALFRHQELGAEVGEALDNGMLTREQELAYKYSEKHIADLRALLGE